MAQVSESGTRYRPNTPRTQSLLLLYVCITAIFDFLVFVTLHNHNLGLPAFLVDTADFMSRFAPAIDGMGDFLQARGYPNFLVPYRVLISVNWILFLLFVSATAISLACEVRKKEVEFLSWIESGYRISLNRRRSALFDGLFGMIFGDPLGKTRIFLAFISGGVLILLYSDFLFTRSSALYFPGYFLVGVWCSWAFSLVFCMALIQFSLIAFYKKRANSQR